LQQTTHRCKKKAWEEGEWVRKAAAAFADKRKLKQKAA